MKRWCERALFVGPLLRDFCSFLDPKGFCLSAFLWDFFGAGSRRRGARKISSSLSLFSTIDVPGNLGPRCRSCGASSRLLVFGFEDVAALEKGFFPGGFFALRKAGEVAEGRVGLRLVESSTADS